MTIHRRSTIALLFGAFLFVALFAFPAAAAPPDPDSPEFGTWVMRKLDDQYRRDKSHGVMRLDIKTKHWSRSLTAEAWSMGTDYSLVRILKPNKEKGSATLKSQGDLFTYLNKTSRTIKISSGMMGGSWMGSHFTNDDLVQNTRLSRDFIIKKTFDGDVAGTAVYGFTVTPKPDAPVVWGKIKVTIRQSDLEPLSQVFYDEDGVKVRRLSFMDHREIAGRVVPMKMVMRPLDGSGEYTRMRWLKLDFDVKLSKSFFSLRKLKSM
jgi:hypothetical protein